MAAVAKMLNSGELAGFKVDNEWRISSVTLIDFIKKRMESERLESLKRTLTNPMTWAKEIRKNMPEFENELRQERFAKDSFGEFLKQGLEEFDSEEDDNTNVS